MKKLVFFFSLLMSLTISTVQLWAAEQVAYTLTPAAGSNNSYTGNCDVSISGITWNVTGNASLTPWRLGGKSLSNEDRAVYSKTAMSDAITKVELTVGAASSITVNSLTLIVASDANFTNQIDAVAGTFKANSTITFQPTSPVTEWATGAYYKFVFNVSVSGTSNKFVAFSEAKFYKNVSVATCYDPIFTPNGCTFYGASQSVEIACETDGATIHYTLDGTDPTESSATYSEALSLTATTTVKAIAIKDGANNSQIASATFEKGEAVTSYNIDFEKNNLDAYVNWEFENIATRTETITAHGGAYYGSNANASGNAVNSASITTVEKVARPGILTFWLSKESKNSTTSSWIVSVSGDGDSWTEINTYNDWLSDNAGGTWHEETANLNGHQNVYVKISYSGSNAFRAIDDISLEMATADPTLSALPTAIDFGTVYKDATIESQTVAVNFANLTGNVSYSGLSSPFSATGAISKTGDKITISADASTIGDYSQTLTISSTADNKSATVIITMNVVAAPEPTGSFVLFSGDLEEGDYVLYYNGKAMNNVITSDRFGYISSTPTDGVIANPDESVIWHIAKSTYDNHYWTLYSEAAEKYAASTGADNKAKLLPELTEANRSYGFWSVSGTETYDFVNVYNNANSKNAYLRNNGTYGFACYGSGTGGALTLYKKADGKPATPTFSVEGGIYFESQSVEISCSTNGASIYYTLDGSTPTNASTPYTSAISISESKTLKAVAIKDDKSSNEATAEYTIYSLAHVGSAEDSYSVADALLLISSYTDGGTSNDNVYVAGIISQIDSYSSQYHSITYWISDDGETTTQLEVYGGKGLNGADFSSENDLAVGDRVVVYGKLKKYVNNSTTTPEINTNNQLYSHEHNGVVVDVEEVTLNETAISIVEGKTATLTATIAPNDASNKSVTWTSSNTNIATVEAGTVTAVAEGTTTIRATSVVDNTKYAECTVTVTPKPSNDDIRGNWIRITDASALKVGMRIIIASIADENGDAVTMGMTQNTNNRSVVDGATVNGNQLTPADGTAVFTLEAGTEENTFAFKSSENEYLYAASSSSNYLRSQSQNDANGSWTISISDGEATITAQGTNTRNKLRYNGTSNLFSCYSSGQKAVVLYALETYERSGLDIGRHYTICLPKKIIAVRGATFWGINNGDASAVYMELQQPPFEAGTPFIFYATASTLEVVYEGDATDTPVPNGALRGTLSYMDHTALTAAGSQVYLMYNNALHPLGTANNHLDANRAYLLFEELQAGAPAPGRQVKRMPLQTDVTTGIEDVEASVQPKKMLIDGQLFIRCGEKLYNATGSMVK